MVSRARISFDFGTSAYTLRHTMIYPYSNATGTVTLTDIGPSPTPYLVTSGVTDYRISCLVRPDRC